MSLRIIVMVVCAFVVVLQPCSAQAIDIPTIVKMESSGNPFARNGSHYGLCQISPAVLKDYNRAHGTIWEVQDLYNGVINIRIARWYFDQEIPRLLKHFRIKDTDQSRITAWRIGIAAVRKGKIASAYFRKYQQLTSGK